MSGQPQQCFDVGCPVAGKHHGFALGSGDFSKVKIVALLETPATNEIVWPVKDLFDGQQEIERRRKQYPALDEKFVRTGAAVVGKAGATFFGWMLEPLGIYRRDIGLVNTLHCYPGKKPDGTIAYPIGNVRIKAEACCSTLWHQQLREWNPTIAIVCLHPSAVGREPAPLPMCLKSIEKAKHFALEGERVLLLMGGKASKAWLGHAENVTVFCGHYESETEFIRGAREERRLEGMKVHVGPKVKKVKVKKLTAKTALALLVRDACLVSRATLTANDTDQTLITDEFCYHVDTHISEIQYAEIAALIAPKEKKGAKKEKVKV